MTVRVIVDVDEISVGRVTEYVSVHNLPLRRADGFEVAGRLIAETENRPESPFE